MGSYKKLTREDIDFPNYCLFFIRCIQEAIDNAELSYTDFLEVNVGSTYPYCYEAFELVVRTFERKGYDVRIPTFHMDKRDGTKFYTYKWKFRKLPNVEGLPF